VIAPAVTAFLRIGSAFLLVIGDRSSICGHIRSGAGFGSIGGGSSHFANRSQVAA